MIQRKQSIWLFTAALLNAGTLYFNLYVPDNSAQQAVAALRTGNHFDLLIIAVVTILLPLIALFMFKNRKRQIRVALLGILAIVIFIADMLLNVHFLNQPSLGPASAKGGTYWIGAILPVIALVFMIMAISGIRRDEKLVKSVDRLR